MSRERESALYLRQPFELVDTGTARIPWRRFGSGEPILFIHGWPLSGFTWRKILPQLAEKYACYVIDLAGAGDSQWDRGNDFSFHGHAEHLKKVVDKLGLKSYRIVAHDTGATVARRLAIIDPERARHLALIDTEIPNHRPPLVPFLQKVLALPGSNLSFRTLLRSRRFLRSNMGFRGCFVDLDLIDGDFREHLIEPLAASAHRMEGQILYARGIKWEQLDELAAGHRKLAGPVLLLWGERDPFFPIEEARQMIPQFTSCRGLITLPGCKLLPHEEKPELVASHLLEFFGSH
jgi:pimeloyl-ACP methyl ester carboxylesterase